MSEIRDRVRDDIAFEMFKSPYLCDEENKRQWDALPEFETKAHYRNLADKALNNSDVAVVDREAKVSQRRKYTRTVDNAHNEPGDIYLQGQIDAQQNMLNEHWVKEVLEE